MLSSRSSRRKRRKREARAEAAATASRSPLWNFLLALVFLIPGTLCIVYGEAYIPLPRGMKGWRTVTGWSAEVLGCALLIPAFVYLWTLLKKNDA